MFASNAQVFLSKVAERLMIKWEKTYGEVMEWIRTRMSFAILRSSILCLRGSRMKWTCLGLGWSVNFFNEELIFYYSYCYILFVLPVFYFHSFFFFLVEGTR